MVKERCTKPFGLDSRTHVLQSLRTGSVVEDWRRRCARMRQQLRRTEGNIVRPRATGRLPICCFMSAFFQQSNHCSNGMFS
jgi:hypothetical protein